ncbi:hypothetical protein GCM10019016_094810 [Streptomyces prasinosporus]|uniref:Uncharacterized protein n=1 Tax=Streptomyces prasinosporus TaxID=68256 RepID=A0ABP6U3X5_9ACTN
MRVPRLVGLMASTRAESARARGLSLDAPGRPDFPHAVVDYVVRQYRSRHRPCPPLRGARVLDFGEGEGGGGVREPRGPLPPPRAAAASWRNRAPRRPWWRSALLEAVAALSSP